MSTQGEHREATPAAGDAFDAAPFGFPTRAEDGRAFGIRWAEPRKIHAVVAEFDTAETAPAPQSLRLEYWCRVWDGRADRIVAERGAGGVGWDAMDDWTNGSWHRAEADVEADGSVVTFRPRPTGPREFEGFEGEGVAYRKTLWIRIASDQPFARPRTIRALTDSVYRPLAVRIHLGASRMPIEGASGPEVGSLEAFNGQIVDVRAIRGDAVRIGPGSTWESPFEEEAVLEADLLMAVDPMDPRYDRTVVTVRSYRRPFSFAADEVARGDRILVDDLGALVTRCDDPVDLALYREARMRESAGRSVYDRVADEDEQTLERAWNDMPLKHPLYFVHGMPGNRNAMHQLPNGEIEIASGPRWFELHRSAKDSDRKLWEGHGLGLEFGFPDPRLRGGRELLEGSLPVLRTWWQDGPVYYEQSTVLDALDVEPSEVRLDDPTVLLMRVHVINVSETAAATARLSFRGSEALALLRDAASPNTVRIVTPASADAHARFRYLLKTDGSGAFVQEDARPAWSADLGPRESCAIEFAIPSVTLTADSEIAALASRDFGTAADRVCAFWRSQTERGMRILAPEPWITDFHKAHLRHMLVDCLQEPDTDLLHAHVGTFGYGVYPNESVMMIVDLDRRGFHDEARRCLDAFLRYQGTVSMPGNFQSAKGQFYGAGGHETGGYNKSHGYVCWAMAEHWKLTRDREWMDKAAPGLVRACDWIARERSATMTLREDGAKPLEYGWLPTGSLEDVTDYWHWLATNSATVWGFLALADALSDYGHPEAGRLATEAAAFQSDFLRGITEARILCPVVRLRDGTYVPKIPSRLYERGRAHGWLRETLEGSIFLPAYGLLGPDAPETRWILKDYEDNLYISDRYGYSIPVFETWWFSRGGFSMQANLLDGPLPYLWRDDIKHFLRAYFNGFASAFYPEIRMCNEHSLPELGYPAGDHFKTSDEAQSTSWLRLMFVNERGRELYLGQAIPRSWMRAGEPAGVERAASHFGPLSFTIATAADGGEIRATLEPPQRNPPERIFLRFRHPEGNPIREVLVDGKAHADVNPAREWIILPGALPPRVEITARY